MTDANTNDPVRLPARRLPALLDIALPAVAVGSGAMLFMAVPNIIGGDDLWSWTKAITLALSATVVGYAVNKLAIERGAPQAVRGYRMAGFLSVGSILAVGGGLFAATYSGLVFKHVTELQLQEHGAALSVHVSTQGAAAAKAGQVTPAIGSITTDLRQKAGCEIQSSCVSGRGNGGRGPVARALDERAGRAEAIAGQVANGERMRGIRLDELNGLIGNYQRVLADDEVPISERRVELAGIDARVRQVAGELAEAVPVAMLSAFAGELKSGVEIPGRPAAEASLNAILARHGQGLADVISSVERLEMAPPAFPKRTGVSDTLGYFGHFLPVAAIAAVVELIFPLALWLYTFMALHWEGHVKEAGQRRGRSDTGDDEPSTSSGNGALPPQEPLTDTNVAAFLPPRRRRNGRGARRGRFDSLN